jgi:hypothetical protein
MAIKANFNLDEVFGKVYKQFQEQIIPSVIEAVDAVCTDVVNEARALPSPDAKIRRKPHQPNYIDDSRDLRNSIGYVIALDGIILKQNFEGNTEGTQKGLNVATKAAEKWPTGIVAVIVAGMDYAAVVESKGYDVLSGPASKIRPLLEKQLTRLKAITSKYDVG